MGLFDLFKSKGQEQKLVADVNLSDIERVIAEKKLELIREEKRLLSNIKADLESFIRNIQDNIIILENVDLSQKKIDERTRLIVKENLFYFTLNLKKLVENLINIENNNLDSFVNELNKKFFDFEKKSLINYEKATFIIGRELGDVKDSISDFFKNLNNTLNENKEIFENLKVANYAEIKLKELIEFDKKKEEIKANSKNNEFEKEQLIKENESFERIIEKIKKSDSYKMEIDEEIVIHEKTMQYEKELLKLREMIDFKFLANFFHSNEKMMNKLKGYKNEFKETFESDSKSLVEMMIESGLEYKLIYDKIKKLELEKEDIMNLINKQKDDEIKKVLNLQMNIKNNNFEIEAIKNGKSKEDKLSQKFEENRNNIIEELRNELRKIDINLIEN